MNVRKDTVGRTNDGRSDAKLYSPGMLKRTALAGLGLAMLVSPLLVSADTLSDLQAQIEQLLGQIQVLKQNIGQIQGNSIVIPSPNGSCVSLSHSLTLDDTDADTDGDVSRLQQFLAQDSSIYPSGRITGYFGPSTLRAVQRWQAANGLASYGDVDSTGYGYVGPKTRAAMAASCGGGGGKNSSAYIKVDVDGGYLLNIAYGNLDTSKMYLIDTDTGKSVVDAVTELGNVSGNGGLEFNAKDFRGGKYYVTAESRLTGYEIRSNIFDIVTNQNSSGLIASPSSGVAPLAVTFSAMGIVADMDFGDGTTGEIANGCIEAITSCESRAYHNYTSAGTYIVKMKRRNSGEVLGTATITVTDSNTSRGAPVVNGIDGPVSLNAGQAGTWTVRATVPNQSGAQLSYSVQWGDEVYYVSSLGASQANRSLQTSATFTHAYQQNGTYKPTFTVTNSYGSASADMTVAVGGSTQTAGTLSVSYVPASNPNNAVSLAAAGSKDVSVISYEFKAGGEAIKLDKIGIALGNAQAKPGDVVGISVWDGSTLVGTGALAGYSTTMVLTNPVTIPNGGSKVLTFKVDVAGIGTGQPGTAGDVIYLLMEPSVAPDTTGTGVSSGLTIKATQGPVTGTAPGVRIVRSYPTVGLSILPSDGLADGRLLRFKVTANPAGDISLRKLTFFQNQTGAQSSQEIMYVYSDAQYSTGVPIPGNAYNLNGIGSVTYNESNGKRIEIAFTTGALQIPAGATYYFELRSKVSGSGPLTTTLMGDAENDTNFVWSASDAFQSSGQTQMNGYGIPGLSAGGMSQTRTGSGGGGGSPSVSISSASSVLRNTIDRADITYDVSNAPAGAAIEIVLKGATGMSSGEMQIVSRYQLDGTTRTFDLSQAQQTFPSHGHLTWSASYASGLVPIAGPVEIRLYSSNGTLLGQASASLRIEANTTSSAPPTVTFIGTPRLSLQYDSAGRESVLIGRAAYRITAGSSAVMFEQSGDSNARPWILNFGGGGSWVVDGPSTIAAGQTATYTATMSSNPKQLFAGSYRIDLGQLAYYSDGQWLTVQASSFINASPSNSVTIVGEVSPYISDVSADSYGNVSAQGARFNLQGNTIVIDGSINISGTKGDASSLSFNAGAYGLANGDHFLQITNAQVGDSNKRQFTLNTTATPPSAPTVTLSANPGTINAGDDSTLHWAVGNASHCVLSSPMGGWEGSPSETISPMTFHNVMQNYTATLTCTGPGGSATQSATVAVSQPVTPAVTDAGSTPQARNATRSAHIADLAGVLRGRLPSSGGRFVCVSSSCYGAWSSYSANASVDAVISSAMQKPSDPNDSTRGVGGYLYFDPSTWGGTAGFTRGYYLDWLAEPADDATVACAPGRPAGRYGSYIGCLMKIGDTGPAVLDNRTPNLAGAAAAVAGSGSAPSPGATGAGVAGFTHTFTQDLYRGQSGAEVKALQQALTKEGLFSGEISGDFYDRTREAVIAFQAKYGLGATGYVGPATRAKLNQLYSK